MNFYKKSGILQTALFVEKWNIRGIFMKKLTILFFMIAAISFFEVSGNESVPSKSETRRQMCDNELYEEIDSALSRIIPCAAFAISYVYVTKAALRWYECRFCPELYTYTFLGSLLTFGALGYTVSNLYVLEQEKKRREFCKFLEASREMPLRNLRKS